MEKVTPHVTGTPFYKVWRSEHYEAGSANSCVVQAPESGYVYAGNSEGVLEFDGARWRLLPLPKKSAVLALAVDARGRVWVGAENEIARLEPDATGVLVAVPVIGDLPSGESGQITRALATAEGIWFGGRQHVWCVQADGRVAVWQTPERFGSIWWMDRAVHTVVSDREVVRLDPAGVITDVFSREAIRVPVARQSPFQVYATRQTGEDEWTLLTALGPVRWQSRARSWRAMPMRPPLFRAGGANAATFLADGSMVFCGLEGGIILVSATGSVVGGINRLLAVLDPPATHLFEDREGGLWLAARDRLARLQLRSAFVRHETPQNVRSNPRQLLRHDGKLFLAHSDGVSRFDEWPGVFAPIDALHRTAETLAVVGGRLYAAAAGLVEIVDGPGGARAQSDLAISTLAAFRGAPDLILAGDAQGLWVFRADGAGWKPAGRLQQLTAAVTKIFDRGDGTAWGATADGRLWPGGFS
ncbi:MAG: hypothetical protein EXS32_06990 [Opitutus sp.]|nr:hypothetical protein [Opitutus sp.]